MKSNFTQVKNVPGSFLEHKKQSSPNHGLPKTRDKMLVDIDNNAIEAIQPNLTYNLKLIWNLTS